MKVLIADGSPEVAERLLGMMQEIPTAKFLAPTATAKATLESVRAHNPEVLIVDARIPGAQGMALLRTLRAEKPSMVLIILTNLIYPQYRAHYAAVGADLIIDKSNEFVHLKKMLHRLAHRGLGSPGQNASQVAFKGPKFAA